MCSSNPLLNCSEERGMNVNALRQVIWLLETENLNQNIVREIHDPSRHLF